MANETSRDRLNPENFSGPSRRFFTEEIRQNKRESAQNLSNANTLNRQRAKQHNDVWKRNAEQAGMDIESDLESGGWKQRADASGNPLFKEQDWTFRNDPKEGKMEVKRDIYGNVQARAASLKPNKDDANDPNLYFEDGAAAGHVDDLLANKDAPGHWKTAAGEWKEKRVGLREAAALKIVDDNLNAATSAKLTAKGRIDNELTPQLAELNAQREAIELDPDYDATIGKWWKPKALEDSTPAAKKASQQHQNITAQIEAINTEWGDLEASTGTDGELTNSVAKARDEKALWIAETKMGKHANLIEQRKSILTAQGIGEDEIANDPIIAQLTTQREEMSMEASLLAQANDPGATPTEADAVELPVNADSTGEEFLAYTGELNTRAEAFNVANDNLAEMVEQVKAGAVSPEDYTKAHAALEQEANQLQAEFKTFNEVSSAANEKQRETQITEIEAILDRDEDFFTANWSFDSLGDSVDRIQAATKGTLGKSGYELNDGNKKGIGDAVASFMSFGSGVIGEAINTIRGTSAEDLARRAEQAEVVQMTQGFRGDQLRSFLDLQDKYSAVVNPEGLGGIGERIATKGRLGDMNELLVQLKEGDTNSIGRFTGKATETFASLANLLDYVPGVDMSVEMRGIDRKNPEEVAKFNVLLSAIQRETSARHGTADILGSAGGSLSQFAVTRKLGGMASSALSKSMTRFAALPKYNAKLGKFAVNSKTAGSGMGYSMMGYSQSISENPNEMGFLARAFDGAANTLVLATAERLGNKGEARLIKGLGANATWRNLIARRTAFLGASFTGENISEVIEAGAKGEDAGAMAKEILIGNAGAVFGMSLLGVRGAIKSQNEFRTAARTHGKQLTDLQGGLSELNALVNMVNSGEDSDGKAAKVIDMIGGTTAIEELNSFVEKQIELGVDSKQALEAQVEWLGDQNNKVLVAGQYAESILKRATVASDVISEVEASVETAESVHEAVAIKSVASALLKIANGHANLTTREAAALEAIDATRETPLLRIEEGGVVLTDGAQEFMAERAPSFAKLGILTETEQVNRMAEKAKTAAENESNDVPKGKGETQDDGTNTPEVETEGDADAPSPVEPTEAEEVLQQKRDALAFFTENNPEKVEQIAQLKQEIVEMEAATPVQEPATDSVPTESSTAAVVSYMDGDGKRQRANIPAGATTANGEAVSESNAAEWLSEQGNTVQSINAFKQAQAKPADGASTDTATKQVGAESGPAVVSYINGDGEQQRANIPAGATTANGEAVSESNAAEWLSEQGNTVQSINAFKQAQAKPAEPKKGDYIEPRDASGDRHFEGTVNGKDRPNIPDLTDDELRAVLVKKSGHVFKNAVENFGGDAVNADAYTLKYLIEEQLKRGVELSLLPEVSMAMRDSNNPNFNKVYAEIVAMVEAKPKTEAKPIKGPVKARQILDRLRTHATKQGGAEKAAQAEPNLAKSAKGLAKQLNAGITAYRGVFGDERVKVIEQGIGETNDKTGKYMPSGGVAVDGQGNLIISIDDLFHPSNYKDLRANPERLGKLIEEEAIHAVALEKLDAKEVAGLWEALPDATKDLVKKAYPATGAYELGHEFLRMVVQGRIAVKNGKLEADGVAVSEDLSGTNLLERIADALAKLRDYFTDLAGSLYKAGATPETIGRVESAVQLIETTLNQLQNDTNRNQDRRRDSGQPNSANKPIDQDGRPEPSVEPVRSGSESELTPLGDTGIIKTQDGTKVHYHFQLVDDAEVVEDPRNTKPGMESVDTRNFVEKNSGVNYDAALSFAIDPTFQQGPPMVEPENGKLVIKGGHRRTYIQRNNRDAYEAELPKMTKRFGLDMAAAKAMKNPVIVAVVDDQLSESQRDSLISTLNDTNQQGVTTAWEATKISRKMTPDLVRTAGALFQRHTERTPLDVLQSADAAEFTQALIDARVLSDQDAKKYIRENGALSNSQQGGGANLFKKVLLATVIDEPRTLDRIEGTPLETKLLNAIGPIVTLVDRGQSVKVLQQAIAAEAERLQLSPEPTVGDFQQQTDFGFDEANSAESQAVHRWFASFGSPQARKEFTKLINDFAPNEDANQVDLISGENRDIGEGLLERERTKAGSKLTVALRTQASDVSAIFDPRMLEMYGLSKLEAGSLGLPNIPETLPAGHPLVTQPVVEVDGQVRIVRKETIVGKTSTVYELGILPIGTHSREDLHEAIIKHFLKTGKATSNPVVLMMAGGGGAGKGTVLKKHLTPRGLVPDSTVHVDPDEIKGLIPEYEMLADLGDGRGAFVYHEESSYLAKQLNERAIAMGSNIILDKTLANVKKGKALVTAYLDAGYGVSISAVTVDPMEAAIRASTRAAHSNRFVPYSALFEAHHGFSAGIIEIAQMLEGGTFNLFDTTLTTVKIVVDFSDPKTYSVLSEREQKSQSLSSRFDSENSKVDQGNDRAGTFGDVESLRSFGKGAGQDQHSASGRSERALRALGLRSRAADSTRPETLSAAVKAIAGERKGKLQTASIASYNGEGNFLRVAYPAMRAGLDRADMPQMPTAYKGAYLSLLRDAGIGVKQHGVKASTLLPTQAEIDGEMISSEANQSSLEWVNKRPILVSNDGYIADGHHRWGVMVTHESRGGETLMQINEIDLSLEDLLYSMESYGDKVNIQRRSLKDHNYAPGAPLKSQKASDDSNQTSLFDLLGGDTAPAENYAAKTPTKARKSKKAFKKQAAKDIPILAGNDAALGDLFEFANKQLSNDSSERSVTKENQNNERIHSNNRPNGDQGRDGNSQTNLEGNGQGDTSQDTGEGGRGSSESGTRQPTEADGTAGVEGTDAGGTQDAANGDGGSRVSRPSGVHADGLRYDAASLEPAARDFVIEPDTELAPRGLKAKWTANLRAIELLRTLESEDRNATPEEKLELAAYTGWGWAGEYFNPKNERYTAQFKQLKALLSEEEFAAARRSTQNAHFTAPEVISSIWKGVERLGFNGGRVLEPAGGIGHFFGLMPTDVRAQSDLMGIELDSLSARLFTKLYPNATVGNHGFEENSIPNNSVDLAISNVPFGDYNVFDKNPEYRKLFIHDYFFTKALDSVKPGGLVAFVTSSGTMQKLDSKVRKHLAGKADLVGAIRLPNNAFAENAGTEVTTDIIFLRKKAAIPYAGQSWEQVQQQGNETYTKSGEEVSAPLYVNEYFIKHPDMALGVHGLAGTMYGPGAYALKPKTGADLGQQLEAALNALPQDVMTATASNDDFMPDKFSDTEKQDGQTYFDEDTGEFYQMLGGRKVEPDWYSHQGYGTIDQSSRPIDAKKRGVRKLIAKDWLNLRDAVAAQLRAEADESSSVGELLGLRVSLNRAYDRFNKRWGTATRQHRHLEKAAFLEEHPDYFLVQATESEIKTVKVKQATVDQLAAGKPAERRLIKYSYKKGDIYKKRVLESAKPPESVDNVVDAVAISRSIRGGLDPAYVAELLGVSEEEAMRQATESRRVFRDPISGIYEIEEGYLSGNVRAKLKQAQAEVDKGHSEYLANVEALTNVLPEWKTANKIDVRMSSRWVDSAILEEFMRDRLGTESSLHYVPELNGYSVTVIDERSGDAEFSTESIRFPKVLKHSLNGTSPKIYKPSPDGQSRVIDKDATVKAQAKVTALDRAFESWFRTADGEIEVDGEKIATFDHIETLFNNTKNASVEPQYTGEYMTLPGLANTVYRTPHRMAVVARILAEGSVMMAHGVGSGKTFSLIIAAYEMKRLGMASKPMIVVQNQTIGQFGASYRQAYPNARVLVANDKDLGKDRRKRFLNRVAVGDWDTIIITQSQFDRLNSNEASVKQYFQRQLVELEDAISRSRSDNGSKDATTKELEKAKEKLQVKQLERLEKVRKGQDEGVLSFEDMGVDAVFVDEAHEYKKVPLVTRMGQVKGVPNDHSDKAMNLEMKIAHIHRIKDGKNIVLATGTPVTNSMAEVFVMLRLAAPKVLESYGIRNFDDFAHTFGKVETKTEFTWKGSWSAVSRFAEFINVNELMTMVRLGFDVKMGNKELGIKVPEIVGGEAEIVAIKHTPVSQKIRDWTLDIATEFESLDPSERKENSWVPIVTMGAGMAGALDPRLIDPKLPDHPNSKVNKAISNVMEIYNDPKQGVENKTQMIFADQFLPFNTERLEIFAGDMDKSGLEEFEDGTVAEDAENDAENDEDAEAKAEAKAYKNATGFNLYKDIKAKLIAQGIPEHEIAIMHEYNTTLARTDLFDRVNAGDVRILLGSTAKMGVGVNAHEKLYALHHLDPPRQMTPAMLEQREGRIVRQGNTNANVRILRYGVEKSMDTGIFQLLERKATFIRDLLLGKLDLDKMKDEAAQLARGMAAQVAALTGDVRLLRRVEIEAELMTLDIEKQGFEEEQYALRRKVRELERASESLEQTQIPEAKQLMAWFKANPTEREVTKEDKKGNRKQVSEKRFEFSLGKSSSTSAPQYTDRKDALEALEAEVAKQSSELANRAVKLNETTRISIPMVWNGVEGSLRLEVNPKVLKGLTPSAIEEASYMSMVLRDPQAAGDSNAKLIYSNPISTVEGVLRVFSSVQRSTAAGESVERYERQLKVSKSTVTPYKQRIGATWEGSVAYEALNTELEKLNADLESSSSLRPRAPLEVGIRQPMVGLNPQLKEPMIGLLSRAATVDANQGEFDLSQAQEEPATPINRANLVTDNLALARYFTGRFSASIPTISRSDVLQEANIALLKAAKAYEPNKGKFGAFASRVIRNHLISVYRKESKHRNLSLDVPLNDESKDELGDTISDENTPSPVDEAEQSETKATLGNAINQLPDGVRMVIAARLRGETFKQIGKSLNISAQAAQERYKKALAKLRKGLTQMGVEAEPDGVLRSQGADRMPDTISNEEAQSGAYQIEVLPTVLDMVARWDAGADLYYFHELDEGLHKIKSGVQLLDSAQSDVFSVTRNDNPSPTPRKRTKAELRSAVGDVVDSDTPNGRGRPTTVEDYLSDEYGYDDAISLTYDEIESGIFDSPERILKTAKIDAYHKMGEVMTEADANEVIEGWKAQALKDGKDQANSLKVVLSLFDSSGILSQPWIDAGYTVYRLDLDPESQVAWDVDVNDITIEFLQDHGLDDVDVVLAQPPCTDFACSGAGHFAAKDADGRTQASVDLIDQTIATIGFLRPHMWMLENPIGRIKTLTGLPEARMVFDPFVYGDPYTKRTQIWGDFNPMLPKAVVEPHLGSIITNKLSGSTNKGKRLRSLTPEGFAYSYYMANRDYTKRFAERVERKRKELDGEEAAPTPPMDGAQQIALFSQAGDVSSAKFKSWFGDSKVVDKSGEPLVMYHGKGTDSEIEVFEMREGSRGKGANFTSVYEEAFDYAAEGLGFDVSDGIDGLDDTQLAKVEARIVEAYIKADEVWDSAYGDGVIAVAKSPNDIKSATDNNGNFDPNDPSINRSQPADTSDDQAIIDLIDSLNEVAPDSTATEEAAQAEPAGEQTIGRPDLANPAASPEGRKFVNAQDEARKEQAEVQSHKEWETQARDMLAKDKAGVKRRLLEVAQDSRYNGITDAVDVKASQMLVAEIVEEAVRTGNADQMREAQILTYAYREARSETARALAAGRDPHQTPAQRHKEFLAAMFFRPDHKTEKRIKKALTPAQKSRDIDKLKAKLKQAEANQADKAELIRLRRELLEVKQAPSKTELLTEASSERLQKIEAALEGMGVSLQDIFSGETEVRIKADAIIGNYAAKLPAKRKQAVSMLERGTPINEVRKATGLSMGEINDITEDFERDYMAKHEAKYLAKLKGMEVAGSSEADLEVISLLKSAPGGLGEAELKALARKAMLKDIAAMGMGKGAKSKSVQAQLRRKSGVGKRRKAKQTGSIEGLDYEWEMDAPKQGDRYQQGAAQRDLDDNLEPPQFDISNPIDVARIARIAETVDADGFDMAYEFWINSILSGPQTHVANITGNALNMTLDMTLQRGMEVAINSTLSAIGQGDADSAQIGEFKHMIHGIMPGIMDGWKSAQAAWLTETSQFEARVLGTQMELGGVGKLENYKTTISGTKGRIIRIPGRALFFMDELFKGIIGRIEVGAQAYRIAKQEGLKGKAMQQRIAGLVNLVGSDAWVKAAEKAKELTFQSDFEEGTTMHKAAKLAYNAKKDARWSRFIVPFVRTILNIFAVGVRKSPVGSINLVTRMAQQGLLTTRGDGSFGARSYGRGALIKHLAEQVIAFGTTAALYGAMEGDDDDDEKFFLITGSRPFNTTKYGVSELHNRAGTPAYSLRMGNFVFQYGRYEPVSTALGITTDLSRVIKQSDKRSGDEVFGLLASSIAEQVMSKTFARGLSDMFEAARDPQRFFSRWASNFASSWMPNIIKQPLRLADSSKRNGSVENRTMAGSLAERVKEQMLPFTKSQKIDVWGNEVKAKGNVVSRLVVPQAVGTIERLNRADKTLQKWNQLNPAETYAPTPVSRRIELDGESYYMNDEEFVAFQKDAGQKAFKLIQRVSLNQGAPTERDIKLIQKAIASGRSAARDTFRRKNRNKTR